jgi:hypothetical protein
MSIHYKSCQTCQNTATYIPSISSSQYLGFNKKPHSPHINSPLNPCTLAQISPSSSAAIIFRERSTSLQRKVLKGQLHQRHLNLNRSPVHQTAGSLTSHLDLKNPGATIKNHSISNGSSSVLFPVIKTKTSPAFYSSIRRDPLYCSLRHVLKDLSIPHHTLQHSVAPILLQAPSTYPQPINFTEPTEPTHASAVKHRTAPVDAKACLAEEAANEDGASHFEHLGHEANCTEDEESEEDNQDQLSEDETTAVAAAHSPTPSYRRPTHPKRPRKTPSLFHNQRKRLAVDNVDRPAAKRSRPDNWTNTVRAGSARRAVGTTRAKQSGGRKMEFRSDYIAKPLEHAPESRAVPGYRRASDAMVEEWVAQLSQFVNTGEMLVEGHPGATRRAYDDALARVNDTVGHMKASVGKMKVGVFEVSNVVRPCCVQ